MVFWFIVAAMTLGVVVILVYPVFAASIDPASDRASHDVEVYRSQLKELDGDVERGTLSAEEAETARAEIGRRLLRANAAAEAGRTKRAGLPGAGRKSLAAGLAIVLLVPAISLSAYRYFGASGLPDLPLAGRSEPAPRNDNGAPNEIMRLVAGAEERLKTNPEDGQGWNVLAPIYLRMGRSDDAVEAFRNANRLLGPSVSRNAGLGEALAQAADGEVTDEARQYFDRALEEQPDYLPARFFVALDLSQEGKNSEAAEAWASLIEKSPADAPWLAIATQALTDARQKANLPELAEIPQPKPARNLPPEDGSGPSPAPEQIAAASEMNAGERREMIEGMVSQLADRLEAEPNDAQGWQRLIRSYSVLGQDENAARALNTALGVFSDDVEARDQIAALGRSLGIEESE
ncbi:cytochrome c-type biogenesis transmembrane protein [Fulvimarina pelagi HTCC2506]|uniref:Cytochrome c-type biogenesis transmembrane protein n=1 Tax=Fulvimarina pelagi HTCC2506 TaxID=314231 RepID=Q0FZ41_9HYPH|nr:c-type cytochrome biogenesis protein CcmI [Fulvimarina pelagi]EAU40117.1 cytochrome c-type biogenesis transmembrane protein [Fulvimarina pelagi HTCC2506]